MVNAVLAADSSKFFQRSSCFLGQSGRGNNWAYGYSSKSERSTAPRSSVSAPAQPLSGQGSPAMRRSTSERGSARPGSASSQWRVDAHVNDPGQLEFQVIEDVYEGIRREAEHCDTAPDFLMLHSLGGGSGSGMGSRLAEHLREEFPRNIIASAAITPGGGAGDAAMQSINSVLALSFLQAYADIIMLFSNSDWMGDTGSSGSRSGGGGSSPASGVRKRSIKDMNEDIAACVAGAVWPLHSRDACGGTSRLRDLVSSSVFT